MSLQSAATFWLDVLVASRDENDQVRSNELYSLLSTIRCAQNYANEPTIKALFGQHGIVVNGGCSLATSSIDWGNLEASLLSIKKGDIASSQPNQLPQPSASPSSPIPVASNAVCNSRALCSRAGEIRSGSRAPNRRSPIIPSFPSPESPYDVVKRTLLSHINQSVVDSILAELFQSKEYQACVCKYPAKGEKLDSNLVILTAPTQNGKTDRKSVV